MPTTTAYTGFDPSTGLENLPTLNLFYDAYGNPLKVITRTVNGAETWQQDVTNEYHDPVTNQWLLGNLKTATTVSIATVPGYTPLSRTRKSAFTYHGIAGGSCTGAAPGQLSTETVEPDAIALGDRTLYQQSAYEYDAFGNRAKSNVSFYADKTTGTLSTRSSETTYGSGKYPLVNTRKYIGNSALDLADTRAYSDARCRMPSRVTDANGNYAEMVYDGFCRKVSEAARTNDNKLAK